MWTATLFHSHLSASLFLCWFVAWKLSEGFLVAHDSPFQTQSSLNNHDLLSGCPLDPSQSTLNYTIGLLAHYLHHSLTQAGGKGLVFPSNQSEEKLLHLQYWECQCHVNEASEQGLLSLRCNLWKLALLTTIFTLHSSTFTKLFINRFHQRSTNLLFTFWEPVIPVRVNSNLSASNPSSFTNSSWHNVTSEPLSRGAYVSITLQPPVPWTLTGMIPRHTCVSPAPVAATATPLPLLTPVFLRDLTGTSLGCNCC